MRLASRLAAPLLLVATWVAYPVAALQSASATDGDASSPGVTPAAEAATLDRARDELEAGRHWHAAEVLASLDEAGGLPPDGRLLLARARAGFSDWAGVREILEGAEWAEALDPEDGARLLGRAYEAAGEWEAAAERYRSAAEHPDPGFALLARLTRAEARSGNLDSALDRVDRMRERDGWTLPASALAWELSEWLAARGDSAGTRALVSRVVSLELATRSVDLYPAAVLEAGDTARAESLYRDLLRDGPSGDGRVPAWRERVADLTLARGDTAEALDLYRKNLEEAGGTRPGMRSAGPVVRLGSPDRALSLAAARALDRLGDGAGALAAYDRYVALSRREGAEPDPRARVERARIAATVPSRVAEAVEEFRALDEHPDPAVGVRALEVWTALRRRQGQDGNVRTLRQWLVERYPDSDAAVEVVYLRADEAQGQRDWEGAMREFRTVAEMAPARSLAGRARMRLGQIQLEVGNRAAAAATYREYLEDFPEGRRWSEAAYWAGRILLLDGDTAAALPFLERVLLEDPISYYGVEASALLGRPFPPAMPPGPALESPSWVGDALVRLDLLEEAGLQRASALHVDALVERADAEGPGAQYPLAEGLIARGWTIEGINRGWALLREGEAWNERLLRILYPYPNREMVEREAREWGIDPLLMAGLIRQESAWDRDIVSPAGAIGLMQVMPATGREVAAAIGPRGFTTASLESAEVNLHLGGRFLRDMLDRFGPDLPLVLAAYNAGPTRAARWRSLPEAGDRHRLTERIPFDETRGYVKYVTRNLALYRALYGAAGEVPVTE